MIMACGFCVFILSFLALVIVVSNFLLPLRLIDKKKLTNEVFNNFRSYDIRLFSPFYSTINTSCYVI